MATEQTQKMITVTPKAAEKIKEFMKERIHERRSRSS
jgi:iron-sulfur cluster assembly protein